MLNRRAFIGASAGFFAASAVRGASDSKMRFAYSGTALFGAGVNPLGDTFNKTDQEMKDALKLCAKHGYQAVEPFREQMGRLGTDVARLKSILADSGMTISTVSCGGDMVSPEKAQATIEDNFKFSRDVLKPMGCRHLKINIGGPPRGPEGTPLDQLKAAAHSCDLLGKRLSEELGMKLGFHPHLWGTIQNEHEMTTILELTDPRYVGLVPDTAHFVLAGMDPAKMLQAHWSRIVAVHLKDTDPKYRNWKGAAPTQAEHRQRNLYQPMGSGGVDFEAFFKVLREHNYSYWVDLDYDAPRKEEGNLEQQIAANTRFLHDRLKVDLKAA